MTRKGKSSFFTLHHKKLGVVYSMFSQKWLTIFRAFVLKRRSEKPISSKTHFWEFEHASRILEISPFWAFSQETEVRENSKEIPCKNEPFFEYSVSRLKRKPISSKTHFWEIEHAFKNLENSRKTYFIENPFLREHTVGHYSIPDSCQDLTKIESDQFGKIDRIWSGIGP